MKGRSAVAGQVFGLTMCAATLLSLPVHGASYVFDIDYFGDDVAALAPGSDDPDGLQLFPGDDFQWTIALADERFWLVEITSSHFPLMAFTANPSGRRTGDFDLVLRNNGVEVFSLSETVVQTQEVHVGTNTIDLDAGLAFDEMFLDFTLTASEDLITGDPVDTFLQGLLPIFGAPESNQFSPGILLVPEPASGLLLGLTLLAAPRRRAAE